MADWKTGHDYLSEAAKNRQEAARRDLYDLFELGSPQHIRRSDFIDFSSKPFMDLSSKPAKRSPQEVHGQPFDFGTLEIFMHPDRKGTYAPHWLLPEGVEVLTGDRDDPIGLYNTKSGKVFGLPTKGPKYPYMKVK